MAQSISALSDIVSLVDGHVLLALRATHERNVRRDMIIVDDERRPTSCAGTLKLKRSK